MEFEMPSLKATINNEHSMRLIAHNTVKCWGFHQSMLMEKPLIYIDFLCESLVKMNPPTPLPEVLAELVPGMSNSLALELFDIKLHRFSSGSTATMLEPASRRPSTMKR